VGEILAYAFIYIYNYSMESKPKFRPLSFILALLVVLGVGAAAYLVLPNIGRPGSPAAAASTPAEPSAPTGWLVYTDPGAGISFRYPPDAHIEADSNALHPYSFIRVVFADPDQASLIIDVRENTAKQLPEAFAAGAYAETTGETPSPGMFSSKEIVKVGSKQAARYVIPPTQTDFMLYIPLNDKMLVIYPGSTERAVAGQTAGNDLFNQVLGSFLFSDKQ